MTLQSLLSASQVHLRMQAREHVSAIEELVDHLDEHSLLPESSRLSAVSALLQREEKGSTGIGGGIAIPHSFLAGIDEVVACYGFSPEGIEFGAIDHSPVHFVVMFLTPEGQHQLHLKTLAAIAKTLNRGEVRRRLAEASDLEEVLAIFAS